jgi:ElaB/YqjD/DUF883 family membrane-anchored ribosome-binding protein
MPIQDESKNAIHKAGNEVANLDHDLSAEVSRLKNDARDFSRNSKAVINDGAHVTVDYLRELGDSLKECGRLALRNTETHIQEKPGQSLAIAFTAGMLASLLFWRRGA